MPDRLRMLISYFEEAYPENADEVVSEVWTYADFMRLIGVPWELYSCAYYVFMLVCLTEIGKAPKGIIRMMNRELSEIYNKSQISISHAITNCRDLIWTKGQLKYLTMMFGEERVKDRNPPSVLELLKAIVVTVSGVEIEDV